MSIRESEDRIPAVFAVESIFSDLTKWCRALLSLTVSGGDGYHQSDMHRFVKQRSVSVSTLSPSSMAWWVEALEDDTFLEQLIACLESHRGEEQREDSVREELEQLVSLSVSSYLTPSSWDSTSLSKGISHVAKSCERFQTTWEKFGSRIFAIALWSVWNIVEREKRLEHSLQSRQHIVNNELIDSTSAKSRSAQLCQELSEKAKKIENQDKELTDLRLQLKLKNKGIEALRTSLYAEVLKLREQLYRAADRAEEFEPEIFTPFDWMSLVEVFTDEYIHAQGHSDLSNAQSVQSSSALSDSEHVERFDWSKETHHRNLPAALEKMSAQYERDRKHLIAAHKKQQLRKDRELQKSKKTVEKWEKRYSHLRAHMQSLFEKLATDVRTNGNQDTTTALLGLGLDPRAHIAAAMQFISQTDLECAQSMMSSFDPDAESCFDPELDGLTDVSSVDGSHAADPSSAEIGVQSPSSMFLTESPLHADPLTPSARRDILQQSVYWKRRAERLEDSLKDTQTSLAKERDLWARKTVDLQTRVSELEKILQKKDWERKNAEGASRIQTRVEEVKREKKFAAEKLELDQARRRTEQELQSALEKERQQASEDRKKMMLEFRHELEQLEREHERRLRDTEKSYREQIDNLRSQLVDVVSLQSRHASVESSGETSENDHGANCDSTKRGRRRSNSLRSVSDHTSGKEDTAPKRQLSSATVRRRKLLQEASTTRAKMESALLGQQVTSSILEHQAVELRDLRRTVDVHTKELDENRLAAKSAAKALDCLRGYIRSQMSNRESDDVDTLPAKLLKNISTRNGRVKTVTFVDDIGSSSGVRDETSSVTSELEETVPERTDFKVEDALESLERLVSLIGTRAEVRARADRCSSDPSALYVLLKDESNLSESEAEHRQSDEDILPLPSDSENQDCFMQSRRKKLRHRKQPRFFSSAIQSRHGGFLEPTAASRNRCLPTGAPPSRPDDAIVSVELPNAQTGDVLDASPEISNHRKQNIVHFSVAVPPGATTSESIRCARLPSALYTSERYRMESCPSVSQREDDTGSLDAHSFDEDRLSVPSDAELQAYVDEQDDKRNDQGMPDTLQSARGVRIHPFFNRLPASLERQHSMPNLSDTNKAMPHRTPSVNLFDPKNFAAHDDSSSDTLIDQQGKDHHGTSHHLLVFDESEHSTEIRAQTSHRRPISAPRLRTELTTRGVPQRIRRGTPHTFSRPPSASHGVPMTTPTNAISNAEDMVHRLRSNDQQLQSDFSSVPVLSLSSMKTTASILNSQAIPGVPSSKSSTESVSSKRYDVQTKKQQAAKRPGSLHISSRPPLSHVDINSPTKHNSPLRIALPPPPPPHLPLPSSVPAPSFSHIWSSQSSETTHPFSF